MEEKRIVPSVRYEVRRVDAWQDSEGWYENESWKIGEYTTKSDSKRSFLNAVKKCGLTCKRGRCRAYFDGDIWTIEDRKTGEPLVWAIPNY